MTTEDQTLAVWGSVRSELVSRWRMLEEPTPPARVADWSQRLAAMRSSMIELKRLGRWTRGPTDLLTICKLHRWELAHSAALSWLCDPEAGHGLGVNFLHLLLARTGDVPDLDQDIDVATEVARDSSRADIVVSASTWTLVIEVKVDAPEGGTQCERLFQDWVDEGDTRFLFLTKTGRSPQTAVSEQAAGAWTSIAWAAVLSDLRAVEGLIPPAAASRAGAVVEYRRTLESLYGRLR